MIHQVSNNPKLVALWDQVGALMREIWVETQKMHEQSPDALGIQCPDWFYNMCDVISATKVKIDEEEE